MNKDFKIGALWVLTQVYKVMPIRTTPEDYNAELMCHLEKIEKKVRGN